MSSLPPLDHLDRDWQIRLNAAEHLRLLGGDARVVRWSDLQRGFEFKGETVFLVDPSGIFRPSQLRNLTGAALSIRTGAPDSRYGVPYDDQLRDDGQFVHYRYRRGASGTRDNEMLRRAMVLRRPVIWFYGLREGIYRWEFPVWVMADLESDETFELAVESEAASPGMVTAGGSDAPVKAYTTTVAKRRLHQARFRELVLSAYSDRCTVCRLGARKELVALIDAAHIRPDRDDQGRPEVPNGLALCKIHHYAYDQNILGIDPLHRIHIREDILEERDGPMLQHGIKEMQGGRISVPRANLLKPREEYLAYRYDQFRAA